MTHLLAIFSLLLQLIPGLLIGDQRKDLYRPLLEGKRVALFSNHTGLAGSSADSPHVLDVLLEQGMDVQAIFSPEHGFRGTADAGARVSDSVDEATGVPILSLYSSKGSVPSDESMSRFDVLVVDIQDVGLRFYTYYVTMMHLMDACAEHGKKMVIFDRPNPNGFYVDGPILDLKYKSGVGVIPIPIVHGMTLGEMALMINGEGWLKEGRKCDLTVVPCMNYTHDTLYQIPVAPSPNLKDMLAIYLYPSMCLFEGTNLSLGRGTDWPFEMYGYPGIEGDFEFTPRSVPGATNPVLKDKLCKGVDLRGVPAEQVRANKIDLSYLLDAFARMKAAGKETEFFSATDSFEKLVGVSYVREMVLSGCSADEIKARWAADVEAFLPVREKYLLYK